MSLDALLSDSSRRTIDEVAELVLQHPELFEEVITFALEEKSQVSARAMRVICFVTEKNPLLIKPWLPGLIGKLDGIHTDGIRMNILKIFTIQPYSIDDDHLGRLVNLCFSYIGSGHEKPGVKAYSLEILYNLTLQLPELIPELMAIIQSRLPEESVAFQTRGRKILMKLYM